MSRLLCETNTDMLIEDLELLKGIPKDTSLSEFLLTIETLFKIKDNTKVSGNCCPDNLCLAIFNCHTEATVNDITCYFRDLMKDTFRDFLRITGLQYAIEVDIETITSPDQ